MEDKITQPLPSQDNTKKVENHFKDYKYCPLYFFLHSLFSLEYITLISENSQLDF